MTPDLRKWFEAEPWRTGSEPLARLQAKCPGIYPQKLLRTLQRRLKTWRSEQANAMLFGPSQETPPPLQVRSKKDEAADHPEGALLRAAIRSLTLIAAAHKIFVNSMSDLFHERVSDAFIRDAGQVMRETPHHNYQILTKRPERMARLVPALIGEVLPNIWLGTSIENADVVDRIEHLRQVPAAIRFISEPLIGAVGTADLRDIHWAIVGGESGKAARPIREEWIDEIYVQCLSAGTAFFFKQWGTWGQRQQEALEKGQWTRI